MIYLEPGTTELEKKCMYLGKGEISASFTIFYDF